MKTYLTKYNRYQIIFLLALSFCFSNCKKYLEVKSDQKLDVPSTLSDLQAIMDNFQFTSTNHPACGEVSGTDYYLKDADFNALFYETDRRMYTWQKDFVFNPGNLGNDWSNCYTSIYYCNTVLDKLTSIVRNSSNAAQWDNIKGQALLQRGYRFLDALQIWSNAYDPATAGTDLGVPLRTNPDFNLKSVRASSQAGFDQAIADLQGSARLLPINPINAIRGSKQAAFALLARMLLYMRNYTEAGKYADSALQINNQLMDYNTLNPVSIYPIPNLNPEVLYYASLTVQKPIYNKLAKIDATALSLYDNNDLRKILFFKNNNDGTYSWRGSYAGAYFLAGSPATDEMYLIRAEANARQGLISQALADINSLVIKRYKTGTFVPFVASTNADALSLIITERRKELIMRGIRWTDIKRLNKEGANISLTRSVAGTDYQLPANGARFTLPIPDDVISESGMTQNP